ncbi:hypothetical protein JD844_019809 [Phrynosoma platyrhinos]|uniref:Thioredoxin domain-containing protein n=1 Tax=Phrynosoma platyrhinos TaxID=52577 RepID=A0ABQ7TQI8_PHRPL|nr:hypothetical protein JD844_019809 [Phrynosoma platyrhinos]
MQRRTSVDQIKAGDPYTTLIEKIKLMRTDLSREIQDLRQDMTDFKAEIKDELRFEMQDVRQVLDKISVEYKKMKTRMGKIEDRQGKFEEVLEGAAEGSISPTEKKSKKGKPIKEEDNILVLKKSNFDQALNESKFLLVEFSEVLEVANKAVAIVTEEDRTPPPHQKVQLLAQCILKPDIALSGPSQSLAAEFVKAAEQFKNEAVDIRFGKVDVADQKDLKKEFNIQEYPTLKFFGKPIHNEASEEGKLNKMELTRLIKTFTMDLVIEYNLEIMFILVDTDETRNGRVIEYFRVTEVEVPAVQILNLTNDARYKMPAEEVSPENLRTFCQNYLEGKAKQHWSSEEIQEGWDKKPVKVLVAKNFDKVAFNKKNHVFVMFHAPWSHNCQKLFPVWEELGKMYESRKNVVIAKVDYTANEILLMNAERYPFFRLFPAGSTTEVIPYKGEYTLDAFAKFLEEQIEARKKDSSKAKKEETVKEELNTVQKEEL